MTLFAFSRLGYWLMETEKPEKAEAIFMLMGDMGERIPMSVGLYKSGYASSIWMVEPFIDKKFRTNKNNKLNAVTETVSDILVQNNISKEDIRIIPGLSNSTMDEAIALASWCKSQTGIKKILIVTSTYHTARVHKIFERVFAKEKLNIDFITPFNHFSKYEPEGWYYRESDRVLTLKETSKTLYYFLWSRRKI